VRRAEIVEPDRFGEPADAARLDVDDATGARRNRFAGRVDGLDRFVEADRRAEALLERRVAEDVVVVQRLS